MSDISGNIITLTPEEWEAFIHGMENPAPPTPEMIALMRQGDELLNQYRRRTEPTPDPRDAEIAALRAEMERLRGALEHYGKEMCEGFCLEYGPNFDEDTCSGCRARRALAGGGA